MQPKLVIGRTLILLFWIFGFYTLGISHISYAEVYSYSVKKNLNMMLPQGWGFFTKNPREVYFELFKLSNNGSEPIEIFTKNSSWKNGFGLSKDNRYIGFEISTLVKYVPHEAWKNAKGSFNEAKMDSTYTLEVKENFKMLEEDTDYVIIQRKPIPYAWASTGQEEHRPFLAARIKFKKESKSDAK